MADDEVQVKFGTSNEDLNSGTDDAKSKIGEVGDASDSLGQKFQDLKEQVIEAFAVYEIAEFINKLAEVGEQITKTAAMTGLTDEQVQTLGFAMERTGGSADRVGQTMARLERNMQTASSGAGGAFDAFQRLGISLEQIRTSSPYEIVNLLADSMQRLGPSVQVTADLAQVGSRGFVQMAAALAGGSAGIQEMHDKLVELNDNLSNQTVKNLTSTREEIVDLGRATQGAGVQAFGVFRGAIDGVIQDLTQAIVVIGELIGWFGTLQTTVGAGVVIAFGKFREVVEDAAISAIGAAEKIQVRWQEVMAVIKAAATGSFSAITQIELEADEKIAEANIKVKLGIEDQAAAYEKLKTSALNARQAILASENQPNKPGSSGGVGAPDTSAADAKAAADQELVIERDKIQTELTLNQIALATKKDNLQEEVAQHQISKSQELALEQQYSQEEYNLNYNALLDELQLDGETVEQKQKLYDQIQVLYAKHQQELAKIAAQGAAAQETPYNSLFKSLDSGFSQMVNGILQGTQTWQQAVARLVDSLAIKIIDDLVVKSTLAWIQSQTAQVQATIAANALKTSSDEAAATAGNIAQAAQAKSSIGNSAAEAAASVYANVAAIPYVGWLLAPPAAAAAFVAVEAFGSGVASFDVGTNYVPQTGLALVHQGEQIIPASGQGPAYSGGEGSGGGDSVNITFQIQAIDTQTGANFIQSNAATIANVVAGAIRNNNSSLSKAMKAS